MLDSTSYKISNKEYDTLTEMVEKFIQPCNERMEVCKNDKKFLLGNLEALSE